MAPPHSAQKAMRPPPVAGTPAPTRPSAKETPVPIPKPGSMPSLPTPALQAASNAPSLPDDVPALAPAPAPGAPAFSVLTPADANLQDVTCGPHRDGRIRNPVPSKLKGKTDGSKGNFSVMHMDVGVKGEATERDAEAKRTSESTALAAQRAYQSGYVALRRSRFVHVPGDPVDEPPAPSPVPTPYIPPPPPPPAPAASTAVSTRRSTLNATETKSEQARLLTLLRSLHPVLVVDQMCKALAFFGGIPGAPPPADGCFPQSAEANGPGSLFVGWVAEIFPRLGGNTSQREPSPARQLDGPVKRGRGRPKGSKATKTRKDKGIKKGPLKRPPVEGEPPPPPPLPPMQGDESWVDVEETVVGGAAEADAEDDARVMLLAQATNSSPPRQLPTLAEASQQAAGQELINQATNAVNRAALPGSDAVSASPAGAKRRGRPKGSKNRPKLPDDAPGENGGSLATPSQVPQPDHAPQPVSSDSQVPQVIDGLPAFMPPVPTLPTPAKKPNQGKGAASRQPPGGAVEPPRVRETPVPVPVPLSASGPNARLGYTQPVASRQPTHQPSPALSTVPAQPSPGLHATNAGQGNTPLAAQKRKRKGGNEAETLPSDGPAQVHGLNPANQENTHKPVLTTGSLAPQPSAAAAARPPPAKRQKKAQDVKPQPEPSNASFAAAPVATSAPVSEIAAPSITPSSRPTSTQNAVATRVPEPVQLQQSPSPASAMASPQSPHHGHFEVQSPTMENYEAQLQAQLEQQSETVPEPDSTQSHVSSGQLAPARIQQQQPQQQQPQQQLSAQSRSPNPQVPQSSGSQSASPMMAQQQTRSLQSPYSQYRAGNNQYAQQHQQQQQQSYASSQSQPVQSRSPFAAPQQVTQASAQPAQKQQYTPKPQQAQQPYASSQQSYSTAQQYSGNQHQLASQQRYQQQLSGSTSTGTVSYTAHQSPQFNPSTNPAFTPADSSYRPPTQTRNVASYPSQRSQSSTPTSASAYRTTNGSSTSTGQQQQQQPQGLATHHAASFAPNAGATPQRSAATTNQGMQGMANSFGAGGNATDWSMFDTGSMDSGQGGLGGMNNGNYGMGGSTGVRASSNAGARFSSSSMGGYEASGLPYGQ